MRSTLRMVSEIPGYLLARASGFPGLLPRNFTFTLSPRCNSRCLTCNIWKKHENDFSLGEWEKTLRSIGAAPYWATISGGEPFLNSHLVDFTDLLQTYCQPAIVNIPTNALVSTVAEKTAQILDRMPGTQVIINVSLDGIGERHDTIRGIKGNFQRFENTLRELIELKKSHRNFSVGIHTVVSAYNQDEIGLIQEYAFRQQIDQFITEMAEERVELDTLGQPISPDLGTYLQVLEMLKEGLDRQTYQNVSRMTQAFRLEYYRLVGETLKHKRQVIPCFAGLFSAQIYSDGTVWPCCVRADAMGRLREVDYDFSRAWFNAEADRIRRSIQARECWCPLANAAYSNMLCHPPTLSRVGLSLAKSSLNPQRT